MNNNTYEYQFVKVELEHSFNKLAPKANHHAIIDRMAIQGWRLVQIFVPPVSSGIFFSSNPDHYELIFEKPRES